MNETPPYFLLALFTLCPGELNPAARILKDQSAITLLIVADQGGEYPCGRPLGSDRSASGFVTAETGQLYQMAAIWWKTQLL